MDDPLERKDSNEDDEVSTREQLYNREDPQLGKRQVASPQQLSPAERSLVLLCGHCGSPLAQVEEQLKIERRRNERLRKIIERKTEKERELESAYRTIAMQMKLELSEARKREAEGEWERLRAELQKENRQLREEIVHLKQREDCHLNAESMPYRKNSESEEKLLNAFYQKEIERLHQKIQQLEDRISLPVFPSRLEEDFQIKIRGYQPNKVGAFYRDGKIGQNGEEFWNPEGCDERKSKGKPSQGEVEEFHSVESPLRSKHNSKSSKSHPELSHSQQHLPLIEQPSRHSVQLNEPSFVTVHQWQSVLSFHSIPSQLDLPRLNSLPSQRWSNILPQSSFSESDIAQSSRSSYFTIIEQPQFQSVSSVASKMYASSGNQQQYLRELIGGSRSQHAIKEHSLYEMGRRESSKKSRQSKNYHSRHNSSRDRELESVQLELIQYNEAVRLFVEPLSKLLGRTIPPQSEQLLLSSSSFKSHLQTLLLLVQAAVRDRSRSSHLQKLCNDWQLQVGHLRCLLSDRDQQIASQTRRLEFVVDYNRQLQFQVAELSSSQPSILESSQRNSYLRSVYRRKATLSETQYAEIGVECLLVGRDAEERAEKCQRQLKVARLGLGKMCDWVTANCGKLGLPIGVWQIDFAANVNAQVENILQTAFTGLQMHLSSPKQRTSSLHLLPEEQEEIALLNAQNEQLKTTLQEKSDRIAQLRSSLSLLRIEEEKDHQIITALTSSNSQLKLQLDELQAEIVMSHVGRSPDEVVEGDFLEFSERKEFNNLHWDRDEEVRALRAELAICRGDQGRREAAKRRKKVFYIDK